MGEKGTRAVAQDADAGPDVEAVGTDLGDEPGRRGSLHLADRVVVKLARAAALEVPGVAPAGASTSRLGSLLGRAYPDADVQVAGRHGRVKIAVVTEWPQPAARVAADVREHVAQQLQRLADLQVDSVAVQVAAVVPAPARTVAGR